MAKSRGRKVAPAEELISLIGPGMTIVGSCDTEGSIRIEGTVQGDVRAGKAVVVGKEGLVEGDIFTQDAVVAGRVKGAVRAEQRLEAQATSRIEGEVLAARLQLEEGAVLNGSVQMDPGPGEVREALATATPDRMS